MNFFTRPNKSIQLTTYVSTSSTKRWLERLPFQWIHNIDNPIFQKKYTAKSIFHRSIVDTETPALIEELATLRTPRGYTARSHEEIVAACERLSDEGVNEILAKPSTQSSGIGIREISTVDDIDNLAKDEYVIEEKLHLDKDRYGETANAGIAFRNNQRYGVWRQLLKGDKYVGALYPFDGNSALTADILRQTEVFKNFMFTKGMRKDGGIDFLISKKKAFLIDNNLGRMTGTHAPLFFQKLYLPEMAFAYFEVDGLDDDIFNIWEQLQSKGLALDLVRKTGVYPVCHLPSVSAEMMAFAPTASEAFHLMEKTQELLS